MSGIIDGLLLLSKTYKTAGGKFLKNTAIEMFLTQAHGEIIKRLSLVLAFVDPLQIPEYVAGKVALPIPPEFFQALKGFEEFLEAFEVTRLFEWIDEASPLLGAAIADQGEAGINYMLNFKQFIIDSVKAVPDPEEPPPSPEKAEISSPETTEPVKDDREEESKEEKPTLPMRFRAKIVGDEGPPEVKATAPAAEKKTVNNICSECAHEWLTTPEEAKEITKCPECYAPA